MDHVGQSIYSQPGQPDADPASATAPGSSRSTRKIADGDDVIEAVYDLFSTSFPPKKISLRTCSITKSNKNSYNPSCINIFSKIILMNSFLCCHLEPF